jgi:hypothetical protein
MLRLRNPGAGNPTKDVTVAQPDRVSRSSIPAYGLGRTCQSGREGSNELESSGGRELTVRTKTFLCRSCSLPALVGTTRRHPQEHMLAAGDFLHPRRH